MSTAPRRPFVAEPPAHYLVRPPLVVDCSALAGLLFLEPWHAQALESLAGRTLHAPWLLQAEIASVALKKHKAGAADLAQDGLRLFHTLDIELHGVEPLPTLELALRCRLSTYDAAYLWLATRLKAPLATFDERLAEAARTHLASLG